MKKCLIALAATAAVGSITSASSAATLYSQSFDSDVTGTWTFNSSQGADTPTDNTNQEANFFFDYSTVGIPAAPGSTTTRGLKLEANVNDGTGLQSAVSVSPTGLVLPNQYILRAYVWQNAPGRVTPAPGFPVGGTGSTQLTNITVGASGASAEFSGGTMSGVQASVTGEGGSTTDWRVYSASMPDGPGSIITPNAHPGVYASGNASTDTNNTATYWTTNFPGQAPPAAQTALFPEQNGTANNGSPAFKWHLWEITKTDTDITWRMDGILIATVPASLFPTVMGNNIGFGQMDINAGTTDAAGRPMLFGLIDNVEVSEIPEPTSMAALGLAGLGLLARRRRA